MPLVSGAAIRLPPERATVFFAAAASPPDGRAPAAPPGRAAATTSATTAAVFRVGAEDAATVAIAAVARLGMPDLSFDGRWLLAPVDGGRRFGARAVDGGRWPAGAARPRAGRRRRAPGAGDSAAGGRGRVPQLRIQP